MLSENTARRKTAEPGRALVLEIGRPAGLKVRLAEARGVHPPDPYAGLFCGALDVRPGERVLDLGCGAGTYAVAAALRGARSVVATDVDPAAVACTLDNARRNGVEDRVEGRVGSLFGPVSGECFDVVVTTLPQLPTPGPITPIRDGGPDGHRILGTLASLAKGHLLPGGRIYLLVTDWAQPERIAEGFRDAGYEVREAARAERAFQPAEYDRLRMGLFAYLDARARAGLGRYERRGSWCYLGISFLECRIPFHPTTDR